MKIQILWAPPAERRFGSGDILTEEQQAEFGIDAAELLAAKEAQLVDEPAAAPAPKGRGKKG